jgi:hypothetical protein
MPVDPPIRGNGGVKGFGFEFATSITTSLNDQGGLRVTPDPPVAKIARIEIWVAGVLKQEIAIEGEWEALFLP